MMHTGTFSTNRITIRGIGNRSPFGTNKIRAYWNDIPLTNGVGETALEDMDWEVFDEVDVLRGPTSGLYGAGLGGLIHLKTNAPPSNQWTVSNTSGSFGLQRNTTKLQMKANDQFHLTLGLNRTHSDGYRANNEYDRLGIYGEGILNFSKVRLSSIINYVDLKAFIPSSLNFSDYQNEPQKQLLFGQMSKDLKTIKGLW
ncbi:MAG: Plug domain-containing protein [Saprospiraceae bacterium]|nr:Plug domain-containing protein [Saprospiraceae bacterium]